MEFAISPDVNVKNATDWFILNTKVQRITGLQFHPTAYNDFADLHAAFEEGRADLIYANAADTAYLVRDKGFNPVASAKSVAKEAVIVVSDKSPYHQITDLKAPVTAAATSSPDIERLCRIMLEPANIVYGDVELSIRPNPVLVAKALLQDQVQVGFFPEEAFDELSSMVRMQLRELVRSRIYVVKSSLLVSPRLADQVEMLWQGLDGLSKDPANAELLAGLGAPDGWERLGQEDVEFMIDLMDALSQEGEAPRHRA